MANEQWVNLIKDGRFEEDGIARDRCGRVTVEAAFEKKDVPIAFKVTVTEVGSDNATYTKKERKHDGFRLMKRRVGLSDDKHVLFEDQIQLPAAGGNKYKIEAEDAHGNIVQADIELETRRKLYYQVIKVKGMQADVGVLESHMEDEYWTTAKKYYLKLKRMSAKKAEIDGRPNYDADTAQGDDPPLHAKDAYESAKDPYSIAVLLTNQLACSKTDTLFWPVTLPAMAPATLTLPVAPAAEHLWVDLDPTGTPEAKWFLGGEFTDNTTGASIAIDPKDVTPSGRTAVEVRLPKLRAGWDGEISMRLKLVDSWCTGLSYTGSNLICVATRVEWKQRVDAEMKSTLVHEMGHKLGMVADGATLARQSTYYFKSGGHCNHGTNQCVMYGYIYSGRPDRFCSVCEKSVRRLDCNGSLYRKLSGFTPLPVKYP